LKRNIDNQQGMNKNGGTGGSEEKENLGFNGYGPGGDMDNGGRTVQFGAEQ
jgi:hypothetical protein